MTKGNSMSYGTQYGNFIRGNKDKLMISYRREPSHDYSMKGACGVLFEGEIHFFGGQIKFDIDLKIFNDFSRQHFVIETQRSGQLVKMTKKENLDKRFYEHSCSSFEMTSEYFSSSKANFVILCFSLTVSVSDIISDINHEKSCYSFNGELTHIGDSNYGHNYGGLTKYNGNLLTVGGCSYDPNVNCNQKTEILKMDKSKPTNWSVVEQDFEFTPGKSIFSFSLVTVESSNINEEYVLLMGGINDDDIKLKKVFKFNGTWLSFGQLNKSRTVFNSIYWNGAVYVIGGVYNNTDTKTKMEVWNINDSPDQFKTKENWPELFLWEKPHLFIVPDSYFPDH